VGGVLLGALAGRTGPRMESADMAFSQLWAIFALMVLCPMADYALLAMSRFAVPLRRELAFRGMLGEEYTAGSLSFPDRISL